MMFIVDKFKIILLLGLFCTGGRGPFMAVDSARCMYKNSWGQPQSRSCRNGNEYNGKSAVCVFSKSGVPDEDQETGCKYMDCPVPEGRNALCNNLECCCTSHDCNGAHFTNQLIEKLKENPGTCWVDKLGSNRVTNCTAKKNTCAFDMNNTKTYDFSDAGCTEPENCVMEFGVDGLRHISCDNNRCCCKGRDCNDPNGKYKVQICASMTHHPACEGHLKCYSYDSTPQFDICDRYKGVNYTCITASNEVGAQTSGCVEAKKCPVTPGEDITCDKNKCCCNTHNCNNPVGGGKLATTICNELDYFPGCPGHLKCKKNKVIQICKKDTTHKSHCQLELSPSGEFVESGCVDTGLCPVDKNEKITCNGGRCCCNSDNCNDPYGIHKTEICKADDFKTTPRCVALHETQKKNQEEKEKEEKEKEEREKAERNKKQGGRSAASKVSRNYYGVLPPSLLLMLALN